MKFIIIFLAIILAMFFALSHGLPQLTVSDHLQVNNIEVEEQSRSAETYLRAERSVKANEMNNEVVDTIRSKRDLQSQNKNVNQNCCGTNSGSGNGSGTSLSNCVCNTYPRTNMNNNNNNMGATIYNNMYYMCNCGTNPNPNNIMNCCVSNTNNRNCNCCTDCQCGCNNGTNVCVCGGNSWCSTSQRNNGGHVCYTFDKTCCNITQNTTLPILNTGFSSHHGPIFIFNNYYYNCTCTPNYNVRHPSICSTTCTCGRKPAAAQPSIASITSESRMSPSADKPKDKDLNLLNSTIKLKKYLEQLANAITFPPIFTDIYGKRKPSVSINPSSIKNSDSRGDTPRDSTKSNPSVYTYTFPRAHAHTPRHPEQTPATNPTKTNLFRRNRDSLDNELDLNDLDFAELLKGLKL